LEQINDDDDEIKTKYAHDTRIPFFKNNGVWTYTAFNVPVFYSSACCFWFLNLLLCGVMENSALKINSTAV